MNKKLLTAGLIGMFTARLLLAETDYVALPVIKDIQEGRNTPNQIETLRVSGAGTVGGALTVSGALNVTGTFTPSGVTTGGTYNGPTINQATITSGSQLKVVTGYNMTVNTGTVNSATIASTCIITGAQANACSISEPTFVKGGGAVYTGTNTFVTDVADKTNVVVVLGGLIKSWTVNP